MVGFEGFILHIKTGKRVYIMKKKIVSLLMVGAMSVMALAGCGSSGSDTSSDSSSESTTESSSSETYTVGIIQTVQHEALDAATDGFQDALIDELGEDAVTFDVQNAAGDSTNCSTIANSFVSQGVDLILANATPALQAAASATSDIPILGTSVTDYASALSLSEWDGTTGMNISGTSDLAPLDQQADMIEELFPSADYANIGILYCTAEANSKYQADNIAELLEAKGYTVSFYTFSDSNDVATVTTSAANESDVIYIPTDNTAASCTSTIAPIVEEKEVPVVAAEEGICRGCGVATLSISYYDLGYATGKMAAKVLTEGVDVSTMEVETASDVTKEYNPEFAEKFGITIPDDYTALEVEE